MTVTENFYLTKPERIRLGEVLGEIPDLVEDLIIAITCQDHMYEPSGRRTGNEISQVTFDDEASTAAEELRAELAGWVRMVCEQRRLEYRPPGYTHPYGFVGPLQPKQRRLPAPGYRGDDPISLARWLGRWIMALAMTEGAEEALPGITGAVRRARRAVNRPAPPPIQLDEHKVRRARNWFFTYAGIIAVAKELGEEYRNLTSVRMDTLIRTGRITPAPGPWRPDWPPMYVLGRVLEAHLSCPIRRRRA